MDANFQAVFDTLKPVLGKFAKRLAVKANTPIEYTLVTKSSVFRATRSPIFTSPRIESATSPACWMRSSARPAIT